MLTLTRSEEIKAVEKFINEITQDDVNEFFKDKLGENQKVKIFDENREYVGKLKLSTAADLFYYYLEQTWVKFNTKGTRGLDPAVIEDGQSLIGFLSEGEYVLHYSFISWVNQYLPFDVEVETDVGKTIIPKIMDIF